MQVVKPSDYKIYSKFLENLAKKLTKFYYLKLNRPFKLTNKLGFETGGTRGIGLCIDCLLDTSPSPRD